MKHNSLGTYEAYIPALVTIVTVLRLEGRSIVPSQETISLAYTQMTKGMVKNSGYYGVSCIIHVL